MKKVYTLVGASLLLLNACQTTLDPVSPVATSTADIDGFIRETMQTKGDFRWTMAPDNLVLEALRQSDAVLSVGYKPATFSADLRQTIHTIDIQENAWQQSRQQLLNLIFPRNRSSILLSNATNSKPSPKLHYP
ncbi:MAG: hypothetical protein H7319_14985 [Spirosoma sp.]|nr:hypothetical protein [Spirosoma sp.]